VSTELVDIRDGSRISGIRRELVTDDVATLAMLIGNDVAQALKLDPRASHAPPVKAEAYRLYLRGRQQWNIRSPEGLRAAIDLYRQAIEIEPEFAPAYAGLADAYSLLDLYAGVPTAESRARAIHAAERAVELDPSLPEAHSALAMVREVFDWDWQESEREFRTATRLSPSYALAHHWLALLLATLGRYDEGLEEIQIARELDPRSAVVVESEGWIYRLKGDYPRSIELLRTAVAMKPDFANARIDLALSLIAVHDYEAALRELGEMPDDGLRATIRAYAGNPEDARRFVREEEKRPDAALRGAGIAGIYVALGDRAAALRWLHRAADARSWVVASSAPREPQFAVLYGDPEWERLLGRLGLQPSQSHGH
jgi:tetratricopeptide (TPR) repeat protein